MPNRRRTTRGAIFTQGKTGNRARVVSLRGCLQPCSGINAEQAEPCDRRLAVTGPIPATPGAAVRR
jgi:hypothetical protein